MELADPSHPRPNLRDRMVARARAQPFMTLVMEALGFGMSILIVTESAETWTMSTGAAASIVAGGTLVAAATYLTGVPTRIGQANAAFWEGGALTRILVTASFSLVAALVWGIALIFLFETRLPR
jgi:hypothetical protein